MKIIETFGPPAVGKSTMYAKVKRDYCAISYSELHADKLSKFLPQKLRKRYTNYKEIKITSSVLYKEEFYAWLSQNELLMDLIGRVFISESSACKKFMGYNFLMKNIQSRVVANMNIYRESEKLCVDGGIVQSFYEMVPWNQKGLSFIEQFLAIAPLPEEIVYFTSTSDQILKRAYERNKINAKLMPGHRVPADKIENEIRKSIWLAEETAIRLKSHTKMVLFE